jgi:hypothetical protein
MNPVTLDMARPSGERERFVAPHEAHGGAVLAYARRRVSADTGNVQTNRMNAETQREFEDLDGRASLQQPGLDPIPVIRRLLAQGARSTISELRSSSMRCCRSRRPTSAAAAV